ncbi:MAG: adenylosuccinate lyase [Gemmataceae bacterium]|nr:adenylosuccinate lyase [Gemmataceae bacterium]
MENTQVADNPLAQRYASKEMARVWSPQSRYSTWRKLWLALAQSQLELGLMEENGTGARIKPEQIRQMEYHLEDIDFQKVEGYETRLRHDVMAHIHAFADQCPLAKDIIHLGATSCYVTDNTDLILMKEGLQLIQRSLVGLLDTLARFARGNAKVETLGFTHFQPAQLTTVGKRACLWTQDFLMDFWEISHRLDGLRFRGAKGTTGTQASFLALFKGDHEKVKALDQVVTEKMGFSKAFPVTGQTYPRKADSQILDSLSGIGQSAMKFGNDIRLLAHRQEVDEPFEEEQVGSSAMAYKRNPMRSERMCGLSRFLIQLTGNAAQTAGAQWLERTLDDSVNRRLTIPQSFLCADAILKLAINISKGLVVNPEVIQGEINRALPFMATENILMAAVSQGGDRQVLHEVIRKHSHQMQKELKSGSRTNDLLERLKKEPGLSQVDFAKVMATGCFSGRAASQVEEFLTQEVDPILVAHSQWRNQTATIRV